MKACEKPEVTLYDIESQTSEVSGGNIEMSVTFGNKGYYVNAFEEMAEKISDETLIDILKKRDPEYIAEDYR